MKNLVVLVLLTSQITFRRFLAGLITAKTLRQAIGIEVEDAAHAHDQCTKRSGVGNDGTSVSVQAPTRVSDLDGRGAATISEVRAYGDVVLRFISFESESESGTGGDAADGGCGDGGVFTGAFLPNFVDVGGDEGGERRDFGLQRADHIVGNVWDMLEHVSGNPTERRCFFWAPIQARRERCG